MKTRRKKTVSMRAVLVLMLFVIGFLPMVIQGRILLTSLRQSQIDARTLEIQNQALILSNRLTQAGYLGGEVTDTILDSQMDVLADVFNGRVVIVDETYRIIRDTFKLAEGKYHISEEVIRCFRGETSSKYNSDKHYLIETFPIYAPGSTGEIDGVMVVTASTASILNLTDMVGEKVTMFEVMALIVVITAILVGARLYLKPVAAFSQGLKKIASGDAEEIHVNDYRETREMSDAVSQAFAKLREVDNSRQEFVSNVSHELKTPITSIRVLADSLMGMEEVPVELYKEFMADISDEIDRETKIINDLLTLVKSDKATTKLNISQVSINNLLEQILKRLRPIAKKQNIELVLENIREVTADVDETKLSLALSNLVENAIKYNREEGWVRVVLDADHKFFYVKVIDNGIGIPEDLHERVFERFYRVDKARSRATGGTGLGLSITKSIVQMHNGALKLQSKEDEGTTFTVRIPLNYIS